MLLVVGPYPPPVHGASRVASLVVAEAVERGMSVEVTSTSVAGRLYHARRALKNLGFAARLLCWNRRRPVEVYQTGAGGMALYYQAIIALAARSRGLRQVFHHHSYAYLNERSPAMTVLVRAAGPRATHVALCDGMADALRHEYGCHTVVTVSNALFLGPGRTSQRTDSGPFVIGHLSNLSEDKGLQTVLDSVVLLRGQGHDVRLRLAGPAADATAERLVAAHLERFADIDSWLGFLDPGRVPEYMSGLDCFAFPSRYRDEALPLVVLEALREGTPVLTSRVGCLGEMLDSVGWVTDPEPDRLAAAIMELMHQDDRRDVAAAIYGAQRDEGQQERFFTHVLRGLTA